MKDDTPSSGLDPSAIIQGHNGQLQRFTLRRSWVIQHPRTKKACREFILDDQYGNIYLVYRAILSDGEDYDVADWVKPSVLARFHGFTDACIDEFRGKAFAAFDQSEQNIRIARHLANQISPGLDGSKLILN